VLRWLEGGEPAASRVEALLDERPVMSWINLGEIFYVLIRAVDENAARTTLQQLRRRLRLDLPTEQRVLDAARIKARHTMAYADAFAVATAVAHDAVLLTGDPEIIGADGLCAVEDLRG
jgi:predicted nucleic acid-binding protein